MYFAGSEMTAPPKVTIMIPTYNQAHCIERAITSALAQDYPHLEVILADDCSIDHTAAISKKYLGDTRFRYVRRERNLGRVGNYRQTLFQDATGDWVLNLDGDDYLVANDFVRLAMSQIQQREKIVLVFGGCSLLEENGLYQNYVPTRHLWTCENGFQYFLRWGVYLGVPHMAALYPRKLALLLDFYRLDIISSDWESLRRLVLQGDVLMYGKIVGRWSRHRKGASETLNVSSRLADLQSIEHPYAVGISLGFDAAKLANWRRDTLAHYAENWVRLCLHGGRLDYARIFLSHLQQTDPMVVRACFWRMLGNHQLLMLVLLYSLGGSRLVNTMIERWRRLTWHKQDSARNLREISTETEDYQAAKYD
jgi:glycosyltransferase involved in cell wall biosynthesis